MDKKYEEEIKNGPSLLDVFKQGDKVQQIYYDPNGRKKVYVGTVIEIKKHCMAIHWDKIDGMIDPEFKEKFMICHKYEIFNGDECYSPITKL